MPERHKFDYAVVRLVPRVERGEFVNVGAILFCPSRRYLEARFEPDARRIAAIAPWLGADEVDRLLAPIAAVCAGGDEAGPIGRLSPRQRFDWLVSPRSTVVQTSPVHSGFCTDPDAELEHLLDCMVRPVGCDDDGTESGSDRVDPER